MELSDLEVLQWARIAIKDTLRIAAMYDDDDLESLEAKLVIVERRIERQKSFRDDPNNDQPGVLG